MQILLTAATANEIAPTIQWLDNQQRNDVTTAITGVGAASTAYLLTKQLEANRPGLVIQAGIGGSFSPKLTPGEVVLISEDLYADLGVIENDAIIDIFDLGLAASDTFPFRERMLPNPHLTRWPGITAARGATVNMVSSQIDQIDRIRDKYDPVVESMEGAAFHEVCLRENIPFVQLRAISNFVGERNKQNWKMKEAIAQLNHTLQQLIQHI